MYKRILLLCLFTFMIGCSATMVSTHGNSTSKYAPSNEKDHSGGLIKYLNQGGSSVIKSRRDDAYKKMYEYCGGNYKITSEGPRDEGGSAMPVGNMVVYDNDQYWYIGFECQKK